jgi:hypothetical protein
MVSIDNSKSELSDGRGWRQRPRRLGDAGAAEEQSQGSQRHTESFCALRFAPRELSRSMATGKGSADQLL